MVCMQHVCLGGRGGERGGCSDVNFFPLELLVVQKHLLILNNTIFLHTNFKYRQFAAC